MGCERMLLPCRDDSTLESPLELVDLPFFGEWKGKIAYIDRDGVLNQASEDYINSPRELVLLPEVAQAVGELRRAGYRICVITNQSPVGRGIWGHDTLAEIHSRLRSLLQRDDSDALLDLILYSPYAPWEGSWARKPNPGMLEAGRQLIDTAHVNPGSKPSLFFGHEWQDRPDESGSVLVGDRSSDLCAAEAHGVRGVRCDPSIGLSGVIETILGDGNE